MEDVAAFCSADGAVLVATRPSSPPRVSGTAMTIPVRRGSKAWCVVCGSTDIDGAGYCAGCGNRLRARRSTMPGSAGVRIGAFTVLRPHADGDLLVKDAAGETRLLVLGPKESMAAEARALTALGGPFPAVLEQGHVHDVGHFVLLSVDTVGATPVRDAPVSFAAGISLLRAALDLAGRIEALGLAWEPSPSDFYAWGGGARLSVTRARGVAKLRDGEPLNAKRVVEALAGTLLPTPFGMSSPGLIRLLLPRFNFSTLAVRSVESARDEVTRAESLVASKTDGAVAALCDPGLRRQHNEDATAVAHGELHGEPYAVLVVCDGVSSSSRADQASSMASKHTRDAIDAFVRAGVDVTGSATVAVGDAIRAAHRAVCEAKIDHGDGAPPGTTIVAALVHGRRLTVGWVGDSRAYWASADTAELVTTDHSWVNDALARGAVTTAEAMASPFAHALTKCLGPLENMSGGDAILEPDVRSLTLPGPCHLILCSDGLWNYFPSAQSIAAVVADAGKDADATAIARTLVCRALAEGGGDNVSVAVYAVP